MAVLGNPLLKGARVNGFSWSCIANRKETGFYFVSRKNISHRCHRIQLPPTGRDFKMMLMIVFYVFESDF
jgi:hypothetical protein